MLAIQASPELHGHLPICSCVLLPQRHYARVRQNGEQCPVLRMCPSSLYMLDYICHSISKVDEVSETTVKQPITCSGMPCGRLQAQMGSHNLWSDVAAKADTSLQSEQTAMRVFQELVADETVRPALWTSAVVAQAPPSMQSVKGERVGKDGLFN